MPLLLSSFLRPLAARLPALPRPFALAASSPFSSTAAAFALARKPTKLKLKTHKGAAKRWTAIANGQFKRGKVGRVHLNSNGNMSPTRLNRLGQTAYARTIERKLLRRLMPLSYYLYTEQHQRLEQPHTMPLRYYIITGARTGWTDFAQWLYSTVASRWDNLDGLSRYLVVRELVAAKEQVEPQQLRPYELWQCLKGTASVRGPQLPTIPKLIELADVERRNISTFGH
ncbi:hypothetical protein JCM11491_002987 [Sporobolomyces phaffii]